MRLARTIALALTALVAVGSAPRRPQAAAADVVDVQVLAFNDFHGYLDPAPGSSGRVGGIDAGGVAHVAATVARLEAANPNTVVVSAGDNIGASPLLSSMFHDEPTVEALDLLGLQFSAVGNHELDEGWWELYRMQKGGCHPDDGCQDGTPFHGAAYQYLSANIVLDPARVDRRALGKSGWTSAGNRPATLFPASAVKEVGGVKIGFIGVTLQGVARIVPAAGVKGLTFLPEAESANRTAAALRAQGVRAIVVLIHQGGDPVGDDYNGCNRLSGPILDIARNLSNDVDVIVSGHTHQAYNCTLSGKLVTSALSYGRLISDISLRIDARTGAVVSKSARNVIVARDVPGDPRETALLDRYRPLAARIGERAVGTVTATISRAPNGHGESALGDVVADAMLDGTKAPANGGAVVAFMNAGGIRTDLTPAAGPAAGGTATITYADVFSMLPFGNTVIVKTMTGTSLVEMLEQQFDNPGPGQRTSLQVSSGFSYAYDPTRPNGQRIDRASITIDGQRVKPEDRYRVAMPDFLWGGGDGFTKALEGTDPVATSIDHDMFVAFLGAHSPVSPGPADRFRRVTRPRP